MYPWANLGLELWQLAHNLGYLFDKTPFYRPWLAWMRVDIRRLGQADYVRIVPMHIGDPWLILSSN
jgi:hypothetical protein